MAKLTEKYVQDVALEFLKRYYTDKYELNKIYVKKEAVVLYNKIKGRADGFIAFKNEDNKIHTVSLEAKSHKTFKSLLTEDKNFGFFVLPILALFIAFAVIHNLFNNFGWLLKWIVPTVASIFLAILLLVIFTKNLWFERHGIIDQVRRYPADEKWIAFSRDAYNRYINSCDYRLLYRAKKYNIGILIVSASKKVEVISEIDKSKVKIKANNLKYYSISKKCEEELA